MVNNAPKQHFLETHEVSHQGKAMTPDSRAGLLKLLNSEGVVLSLKDLESIVKTEGTRLKKEIVALSGEAKLDDLFNKNTIGINTVFSEFAEPKVKKEDIEKTLKNKLKSVQWYKNRIAENKSEVIAKLVAYVQALRKQEKHNHTVAEKKKVPAHTICQRVLEKGLKNKTTTEEKLKFIQKVALAFGDLVDSKTIASAVDVLDENGKKGIDLFIETETNNLRQQKFRSPKIDDNNPGKVRQEYRDALDAYQTLLSPETERFVRLYVKGKGKSKLAEQYLKLAKEKSADAEKHRKMIDDDKAFVGHISSEIAGDDDPEKTEIKEEAKRHRILATKRVAMETKREKLNELINQLGTQRERSESTRFQLNHYRGLIGSLASIDSNKKKVLIALAVASALALPPALWLAGHMTSAKIAGGLVGGGALFGAGALVNKAINIANEWKNCPAETTIRWTAKIPGGLNVASAINTIMGKMENMFQIPAGASETILQRRLEGKEGEWKTRLDLITKDLETTDRNMAIAEAMEDWTKVEEVRKHQQTLLIRRAKVEAYYNLVKKELDSTKQLIEKIKGSTVDKNMSDAITASSESVKRRVSGGIEGFKESLDPTQKKTMETLEETAKSEKREIEKKYNTAEMDQSIFTTNPNLQIDKKIIHEKWLSLKSDPKIRNNPTHALPVLAMVILKENLIPGLDSNDPAQRKDLLCFSYNIIHSTSSLF